MTFENHRGQFIDQDFTSDSLLYDLKRKIEDSLVIPDELLEKCEIDQDDTRLKVYLEKFCDETEVESVAYTDIQILNAVNDYITGEVNNALKSHHVKLINNLKRVTSDQKYKPSIEHIKEIEDIDLDEMSNKDWFNILINDEGQNIHQEFQIDLIKQVDKILLDMESHSPWGIVLKLINESEEDEKNADFKSNADFDEAELDKHEKIFLNGMAQLVRIVRRTALNYQDFVLGSLKNDHKLLASVKNNALNELEDRVSEINNRFQSTAEAPVSRKERRELKKAAYIAGKSVTATSIKIENIDMPKVVQVEVNENIDESYDSDDDKEYINIGEVKISLPWMEGVDYLDTKLYVGNQQDVFITKAFSPRVKKISRDVREGLPKNSKGEDKIDHKINQIVKRISEGIMPFQNTNSVKSLATDPKDISPLYRDESIWYSFEIKPNAPRVYFTVHETPEVLKKFSDKESKLVIIIAEADKARQIDTLSILTTLSVASLRARGAGSV